MKREKMKFFWLLSTPKFQEKNRFSVWECEVFKPFFTANLANSYNKIPFLHEKREDEIFWLLSTPKIPREE